MTKGLTLGGTGHGRSSISLIAPKTEFFERIRNVPELRSTHAILTAVQALE